MRNPFLFFSDLFRQPRWVVVWVAVLASANFASLLFWSEPLAKGIFIIFMLSAMLMMALYSYFGFEKILGIGHVFWIFLVPYMVLQLPQEHGSFYAYLVALSVMLTISLVFDVADVWKYFAGRVRATREVARG